MKYLNISDKRYRVLTTNYNFKDNIGELYSDIGDALENTVLTLGKCLTYETVDSFQENVNIYSSVSKVPKGIAKGRPFKFVSDVQDADIILVDNFPVVDRKFGCDTILKSKSTGMFILYDSSDFPNQSSMLKKLEARYNISDFKEVFCGEMYLYNATEFKELTEAMKSGVKYMKTNLLTEYYLDSLPPLTIDTLKQIHKMIICADSQTKELGLKMLIQYNPKNFPMYMSYIFGRGNMDITNIRSHSSYVNFYAGYCISKGVYLSRWGRKYINNYITRAIGDDLAMLTWVRDSNFEL